MSEERYSVKYPRKILQRQFVRGVLRLIIPIFFDIEIKGRENFPKEGPLVVVGNHVAVMEAVLMTVYAPWLVEVMGASDIPHEWISELSIKIFGRIPVKRGHMDRPALKAGIGVLEQGGVIGLFPEGGIWEPNQMKPHTGVSFLSYHGNAPVVPIGFGGMLGALAKALKFKRPKISMNVGKPIPAAKVPEGMARKTYFEEYAEDVIRNVRSLIPPDDPTLQVRVKDESFELDYKVFDEGGSTIDIPRELKITEELALTKLLHRPVVLKIFRENLKLDTGAIENLDRITDPREIYHATTQMLEYLKDENPYLFAYRFGPKQGEDMHTGLQELHNLCKWSMENGYFIQIVPTRRFFDLVSDKKIEQVKQNAFQHWM
jgi:1-acyl-sn-glycerol-3-phosphate acyltransferase